MDQTTMMRRWLGVDIGATKVLAVATDGRGGILGSIRVPSRREGGPASVLQRVIDACRKLEDAHGRASGVGAGFAGLVDWRSGKVMSSIMLPGWEGYPLAAALRDALEVPAVVDNDATAAGFGEWIALGSPPDLNLVVLTVGTGIGGAILIGGRLYRGATGTAAEFGNSSIDWNGPECWCGNRGCLNALASGTAIAERARALGKRSGGSPDGAHAGLEEVARAAESGDAAAAQAIDEGARALGAGIANVINVLNPDLIVLCGGVTFLGGRWLDAVRSEALRRAFKEPAAHVRIALSRVGYEVGAFGAACLAREQAGRERG